MAQVTPNTAPNASKATRPRKAKAQGRARVARKPRLKLIDLHDQSIDPKGRVDVLVARGLKLMVAGMPNPLVQSLYGVAQPVIDAEIQRMLGQFNISDIMNVGRPVMPSKTPGGKAK